MPRSYWMRSRKGVNSHVLREMLKLHSRRMGDDPDRGSCARTGTGIREPQPDARPDGCAKGGGADGDGEVSPVHPYAGEGLGQAMTTSILLDPKKETLPVIHAGDYGFRRLLDDDIVVTNRGGQERTYSVLALQQIGSSRGMPLAIRSMAWAALEWAEKNP